MGQDFSFLDGPFEITYRGVRCKGVLVRPDPTNPIYNFRIKEPREGNLELYERGGEFYVLERVNLGKASAQC